MHRQKHSSMIVRTICVLALIAIASSLSLFSFFSSSSASSSPLLFAWARPFTSDRLTALRLRRSFGSNIDQANARDNAPHEAHASLQFDTTGTGAASAASTWVNPLLPTNGALLQTQYVEFKTLATQLQSDLAVIPEVGTAGVRMLPRATDAEVYGFLNAFNAHAPDGHTLADEFADVLSLQTAEYSTFRKFFLWIEIPNLLYSVRDDSFTPLTRFHRHRMAQRYAATYREDVNFMTFSPEGSGADYPVDQRWDNGEGPGELYRMILLKWKLEHVNDILDEATVKEFAQYLFDLRSRLQSSSSGLSDTFRANLVPGMLQYYYSTFLEDLAHFRLNYVFRVSVYNFDADFMQSWDQVQSVTPEYILANLTVSELLQPVLQRVDKPDEMESVADRLINTFTAQLLVDSRQQRLLNRSLAALDTIQASSVEALLEGVLTQAREHDAATTSSSQSMNSQTQRRLLEAIIDTSASMENSALQLLSAHLSDLSLPARCLQSPAKAVCESIQKMQLVASHRSHALALVNSIQTRVNAESRWTDSGNMMSQQFSANVTADAINTETAKAQSILAQFEAALTGTLVMQVKLLEPWLLRDASDSVLSDSEMDSLLFRVYALAGSMVEIHLPSTAFNLWSKWMLVHSHVYPNPTGRFTPGEHVHPARASWSELSQLSFEQMGMAYPGLEGARVWRDAPLSTFSQRHATRQLSVEKDTEVVPVNTDKYYTYETVLDISLEEAGANNTQVGSDAVFNTADLHTALLHIQLQAILNNAGVSNVDFHSELFLQLVIEDPQISGQLSSLQLLVERLALRESANALAFALDAPKSWHSDRTKSPSAAYDFTLSTTALDLLVYLDSLCFAPAGHVYLEQVASYHSEQLLLITRKINAGDKDKLERTYRAMVPQKIWLAAVSDFERFRWSWPQTQGKIFQGRGDSDEQVYPEAISLMQSKEAKAIAKVALDIGISDNMSLSMLLSAIATACYAAVEILKLIFTRPWARPSLVLNGSIAKEAEYHREYERREFNIVWFRHLPLKLILNLLTNMLLCVFALTINFSFFSPAALFLYVCIFSWLTSIVIDVYLLKVILYAISLFLMPLVNFRLRAPMCACCIPASKSMLVLNPLRPANDEQLKAVVAKNVDMLWGVANRHVVSVLILQAVGNSTETYRRYERIVRDVCYDSPSVPQHVKGRFFVFQMGGISKPHNMYKVMRWFFMGREEDDPVTANFVYGIDTEKPLDQLDQHVRRVPEGEQLPLFLHYKQPHTRIQIAVPAPADLDVDASLPGHDPDESLSPIPEGRNGSGFGSDTSRSSYAELFAPERSRNISSSRLTQAASEVDLLHLDAAEMQEYCTRTFEPLLYLGGNTAYKGNKGQGADAGILCTPAGAQLLSYLRNERTPGKPLLENFLVLDADNYVEPVTLLRMCHTMSDDYLVWQPSIQFYNQSQSMYSYVKNYANEHLGNIMCNSNTLILGGVRSFGKYFGRLKRYYYEECTAASTHSAHAHYPALYSLIGYMVTVMLFAILIRPLYQEYLLYIIITTVVTVGVTLALTLWSRFGCRCGDQDSDHQVHVKSRYQNMFPLNRMFIQSEDARHGGPFGRAAFIMDDCIHEATPPCPIDDSRRENTKWMPTFDMRDWVLLHTPLLWCMSHLILSIVISAVIAIVFLILTIISWTTVADGFLQCLLLLLTLVFVMVTVALAFMWQVATPETLRLVAASRLPEMPERAEYAEALVARGVFGEGIWACQFLLGLTALLFPGTIEVAFPFLGESMLLFIIILLVHPKFTGALLTRIHRIARPRYNGEWIDDEQLPTDQSISPSPTNSRRNSWPTLSDRISNAVISGEGDYVHITLFADSNTSHLRAQCGHQQEKEQEVEADDEDSGCCSNFWAFLCCRSRRNHRIAIDGMDGVMPGDLTSPRSPQGIELASYSMRSDIPVRQHSWNVVDKADRSKSKRVEDDDFENGLNSASFKSAEEAVADSSLDKNFLPGAILGDKRAQTSNLMAEILNGEKQLNPRRAMQQIMPFDDEAPIDYKRRSEEELVKSEEPKEQPIQVITLAAPHADEHALLYPLSEMGEKVLDGQLQSHVHQMQLLAERASGRRYLIRRESRLALFKDLILGWVFHDIPVGMFEFAASTAVFLVKIVNKPFQVLWAMIGVYLELRGLLAAVPVAGTWPSFVESEETLPLAAYIDEYNLPMACGVAVLLLCLPGLTSNIMQIPGFQQYLFSHIGLAIIGAIAGVVLGLYPAWRQYNTLHLTLLKPSLPANLAAQVAAKDAEIGIAPAPKPAWHTQYEWKRLRQFGTIKMLIALFVDVGILVALLVVGLFSYALAGMIPSVFFVRSFPILVSSFIFGPAVGFLIGRVFGAVNTTTNPPTLVGAEWTSRWVVILGWLVTGLSVYFTYFFVRMLLPVQALGVHGPTTPTGDGSMSMMLPFNLSYNEMLKAPWYFVIPYASIVYGGVFLGTVAWTVGIIHQVYTTWREYQEEKEFQEQMAEAVARVVSENYTVRMEKKVLHEQAASPEPLEPDAIATPPLDSPLDVETPLVVPRSLAGHLASPAILPRSGLHSTPSASASSYTRRIVTEAPASPEEAQARRASVPPALPRAASVGLRAAADSPAPRAGSLGNSKGNSMANSRGGSAAGSMKGSPALVNRLMESPFRSLAHMRVKEAQAEQDLREKELAEFTPKLTSRPRLIGGGDFEAPPSAADEQKELFSHSSKRNWLPDDPLASASNPSSGHALSNLHNITGHRQPGHPVSTANYSPLVLPARQLVPLKRSHGPSGRNPGRAGIGIMPSDNESESDADNPRVPRTPVLGATGDRRREGRVVAVIRGGQLHPMPNEQNPIVHGERLPISEPIKPLKPRGPPIKINLYHQRHGQLSPLESPPAITPVPVPGATSPQSEGSPFSDEGKEEQ